MANKKILVDYDFSQNEVQNAVIQNLATAPANPKAGQQYFNTADNKLYVYDGTNWVDETSQGQIYTGGDGIDISGSVIAVDNTVAKKTDIANGTLTIQRNGTTVTTFTANQSSAATANITVPVTAADVNALPDTTKYVANASMTINSTTYVVTLQLKDQDGNNIGTAQTIDLPLESVVVSGSYDSATKEVVLTLENGSTIRFSVADLVSGLQTEITSTNKLDADLVDDSTSTNKFVSAAQRTQIGTNASNITTLQNTIAGYGDIVTHNASEFTKKLTATNPALTVSSGVCTWTIANTLGTQDCVASVREVASNEEVACSLTFGSANITIKMNSASNISAGVYKATIIG